MGPCCSSKIEDIQRRYGNVQIKRYFLSKIQLEYLKQRGISIENDLHQHVVTIEKTHMDEISRRQNNVSKHFKAELQRLRTQQQLVQESQIRHNMKIEEIVGLDGVKKKFIELRNIVRDNIQKMQQQIIKKIRLELDIITDIINRKMQPNLFQSETFMTTLTSSQIEQLILGFKETKRQDTKQAEEQIEDQIRRKINFDLYLKKFIGVVPEEQLLALSEAPKLKEEEIFMTKMESTVPVDRGCCWCFPDFF